MVGRTSPSHTQLKESLIDIFSLSDIIEEEISLEPYLLSTVARDSPDENPLLPPESSLSSPMSHFPTQTAEQSMIHIEDFKHFTYRGRLNITCMIVQLLICD